MSTDDGGPNLWTDTAEGVERSLPIEHRRMLIEDGLPEHIADTYLAWVYASEIAAGAAARRGGTGSRRLPRSVVAELRCPKRGHLLATVVRVKKGPLLWPATAEPLTRAAPQERRDRGRDGPPAITGHYMVDRGYRKYLGTDSRARLLTVPASLGEWLNFDANLWCRCGRYPIDYFALTEHFGEGGTAQPHGKTPVLPAERPGEFLLRCVEHRS